MKLTKDEKKEDSKKLSETLRGSPFIYFTAYKGLKFQELASLRSKLKSHRCSYKIVKNSQLAHALKQAGIEGVDAKLLDGPNAVLLARGDDPVGPAKVLAQFAKEFPALKIKAGFVDAQWLAPADCERLSKLGTKQELVGRVACVLYSTLSQSAAVLAAPIRDFALVLKALEEKKKSAQAAA
ncbi:MAG: 50S ribosomal protein L10 [Elusimicrobia bacterium]|nr:50S ribosomal protein L10 [Elusimicrobiota bacterium]